MLVVNLPSWEWGWNRGAGRYGPKAFGRDLDGHLITGEWLIVGNIHIFKIFLAHTESSIQDHRHFFPVNLEDDFRIEIRSDCCIGIRVCRLDVKYHHIFDSRE